MSSPAVPSFDTRTLQPSAALGAGQQGPASDRKYISEGDGFTLIFSLPFERQHIYKELTSPRQLGVDHSSVEISITRRTDAAQAKLERELTESARGNERKEIMQHVQASLLASLSVGCERTVTFPDGVVVSELVELVEPSVIRWRQLKSERSTNMVGKPGGELPEVTIALDALPDNKGTSIRMTYDFYQIIKADGTPLDGGMMSKLLSQATQVRTCCCCCCCCCLLARAAVCAVAHTGFLSPRPPPLTPSLAFYTSNLLACNGGYLASPLYSVARPLSLLSLLPPLPHAPHCSPPLTLANISLRLAAHTHTGLGGRYEEPRLRHLRRQRSAHGARQQRLRLPHARRHWLHRPAQRPLHEEGHGRGGGDEGGDDGKGGGEKVMQQRRAGEGRGW